MSSGNRPSDVVKRGYSVDEPDEPLVTIVETVSKLLGLDSQDLEPLQKTIDVEAMAQLLGHSPTEFYREPERAASIEPSVSFVYEGCQVTVTPDLIRVQQAN